MDFQFTPEQEQFRREIQGFLQEVVTPELRAAQEGNEYGGVSRDFSRMMGQRRWIGLTWPKEYGGQALGHIERLIYDEEMVLNQAPRGYHHIAERQMGPSIIMYGTEEQKRDFLPRIVAGELGIAVGYSEPDSGSDLASLQIQAVEDGDDYVINGTKVWNSAYIADYMWLATRTNPDAPKHRGISVFLTDLTLPGITIQKIPTMGGGVRCQVYFDNVRIPKSMLVGEKDMGWYVVVGNLDFERAGIERVASLNPMWQDLLQYCRETRVNGRPLAKDPVVRHKLSDIAVGLEVGKMLCYHVAWMQSQGLIPNAEASISKLHGSELSQRLARTTMQMLGLHGQLTRESKHAVLRGRAESVYQGTVASTIGGGTSEIHRGIIANRGLGMPRA